MEENCNDIIDENDHNHGVEGAVCDTELFGFFLYHCSMLLTSLQVCFLVKEDEVCIHRFIM